MKDETWIDKIADKIIDVIDERIKKPGESYSTMAQVIKVDKTKGTAWVAIPGGNPETPAALSIDCKAGDTVQVYVSGHKATLTGNMTAPPTDDTTAIEVKEEVKRVGKTVDFYVTEQGVIKEEAENAQETADNAMTAANGKNKLYFASTAPSGGTYAVGDTWFDTANDNAIYHWDGSQWQPALLGDDALDTFSANHIVAGSIDASQVTIFNLDASNISSGTVAAQYIDAAHLKIGDMINDAGFITAGDVATWYTGTAMTGTNTTPHTVSGSGVANAIINDIYLNTSTDNIYQCTLGGGPSVALWKYVGNIGGDDGKGISSISKTGTSGNVDTYTITYTDGSTSTYQVTNGTDVTSQYVTTITGKTGIAVHMANDTSNYALVNSNGLYVYKGGNVKTAVLAGEMDFYTQYNGADYIPLKMTYSTSGYRKGSVISEDGNYKAYLELYAYSGNNAYAQLRAQKGTGASDRSVIDIAPDSISLNWHNVGAFQIGTGGSGSFPLITERGDVVADSFAISISSSNFTTTVGSISSVSMRRYGGVIQLTMTVTKSSATSAGSNVYSGTLKLSDYRPKALIECGSYSGSVGVVGSLDTDGSIIARVVGAELPSGRSPILTFTYLI